MNCLNLTKLLLGVLFILISSSVTAQERTVSGKVIDPEGKPIQGVTVKIKNSTISTVTNIDGVFSIKAPSPESVIIFSHISFVVFERKAGKDDNVEIKLTAAEKSLETVVVVGYGSQKQRNITGSVATVDPKTIEGLPVSSIAEALKGQVPGLNVSGGSQRPGDNATISIRQVFGYSKDGSSTLPLIIIDDIIQVDPNTGLPTMDQFNNLNPNEVESITVLRDASASIYGARAVSYTHLTLPTNREV